MSVSPAGNPQSLETSWDTLKAYGSSVLSYSAAKAANVASYAQNIFNDMKRDATELFNEHVAVYEEVSGVKPSLVCSVIYGAGGLINLQIATVLIVASCALGALNLEVAKGGAMKRYVEQTLLAHDRLGKAVRFFPVQLKQVSFKDLENSETVKNFYAKVQNIEKTVSDFFEKEVKKPCKRALYELTKHEEFKANELEEARDAINSLASSVISKFKSFFG